MADIQQRELTEFQKQQLLQEATDKGFTISERGNEFGGGKVVVITHEADPDYYGWFQKEDNFYVYFERLGKSARLSYESDSVTEGGSRKIEEVSSQIRSAHKKCVAPEEITVEPGAKVPERFSEGDDSKKNQPNPKRKSAGEMNKGPEDYLGEEVDRGVVDDMGVSYEDDQGHSVSTPKTMSQVSQAIKGASK